MGPLRLVASSTALMGVFFREHRGAPPVTRMHARPHAILDRAQRELHEYFEGRRRTFETPLDAVGTPFMQQVWRMLVSIPFGERWSYRRLAAAIDRPRSVRAAASANARNPLSIFVPCHRVVGSDGLLRGYAGGLEVKRWLLEHEGEPAAKRPLGHEQARPRRDFPPSSDTRIVE